MLTRIGLAALATAAFGAWWAPTMTELFGRLAELPL